MDVLVQLFLSNVFNSISYLCHRVLCINTEPQLHQNLLPMARVNILVGMGGNRVHAIHKCVHGDVCRTSF